MFLQYLDKLHFPFSTDLYSFKVFTPIFIIVLTLKNNLLSFKLVVSLYDLQPIQKNLNRNKKNHFLIFVLSLVLDCKP